MRIKITRGGRAACWYHDRIGVEFDADFVDGDKRAFVYLSPNTIAYVESGDYEVAPDAGARPFDPCEWGFTGGPREWRLLDDERLNWNITRGPDGSFWIDCQLRSLHLSGGIWPAAADGAVLMRLLGITKPEPTP